MAKYSLQPNEAVLLKDESVAHGGFFAGYTDELILTNLHLVLVKKGLFGNGKGIRTFPINQVKVHDGQAQALIGKKANGSPALDVYFVNGHEQFDFQSGGKKKIQMWISKLNQAATGQESSGDQNTGMALPGAFLIAGVLKDTFGVFKTKLGPSAATATVAAKCGACGAPSSGARGSVIKCEYCGTAHQL